MSLEQQKQSPFASAQAVASVLGQQLMALKQLSSEDISMLAPLIFANQPNIPTGLPAFQAKRVEPEQRLSQDSGIDSLLLENSLSDCGSDVSEVFEGEKNFKSDVFDQEQVLVDDFDWGIGPEEINQYFKSLNAIEISKPPNPDVFSEFSMLELLESDLTKQSWATEPQAPVDYYQPPLTPQSSMASPYQSPAHSVGSPYQSTDESGFESDFDATSLASGSPIPDPVPDDSCVPMPVESVSPQIVPDQPPAIPPAPRRRRRGPKKPAKYNGTGPIQLWQFLLELLLSPQYSKLIQWTYDEKFEFKLLNPPQIATMWGKRKNKPNMNYEKLSRGLRYYYGKHIVDKVHGKRYVYQFVCDITKILGYNPTEEKPDGMVEDAVCGELEAVPQTKLDASASSDDEGDLPQWDFSSLFSTD